MSTEIAIAIVTSVASLAVAVVSLAASLIGNRQSAQSARAIETLRFELADKKTAQAMGDKYLIENLESLGRLIQAIQRAKDVVQWVLTAEGTSLDSESAIRWSSEARAGLVTCFEEALPNLNEEQRRAAHEAKDRAVNIDLCLQQALQHTSYASEITKKQEQALTEQRNNLTDMQNVLRDSRAAALARRLTT
jgi:hypothetical protein